MSTAIQYIAMGKYDYRNFSEELQDDPKIVRLAALKGPGSFEAMTEKMRRHLTKEMCLNAVRRGVRLCHIPEEFRTADMCEESIAVNGTNICHVPGTMITAKMCSDAAKNGAYLSNIPYEYRTKEICLEAIKRNKGYEIRHVPKELLTEDFCLRIVDTGECLPLDFPKDKLTQAVCIRMMEINGMHLVYIPAKKRQKRCVRQPSGRTASPSKTSPCQG